MQGRPGFDVGCGRGQGHGNQEAPHGWSWLGNHLAIWSCIVGWNLWKHIIIYHPIVSIIEYYITCKICRWILRPRASKFPVFNQLYGIVYAKKLDAFEIQSRHLHARSSPEQFQLICLNPTFVSEHFKCWPIRIFEIKSLQGCTKVTKLQLVERANCKFLWKLSDESHRVISHLQGPRGIWLRVLSYPHHNCKLTVVLKRPPYSLWMFMNVYESPTCLQDFMTPSN